MPTTQEVAERLIELVNQGKNVEAERELYAEGVRSYEQDGTATEGLEAAIAKTEAAHAGFEEFYGATNTLVGVNHDSFLIRFEMDFKPKGGERLQATEYGFYKLDEEGKVAEEYFYFA